MKILTLSASDRGGGASRVAWSLFDAFKKLGVQSWLSVGSKFSTNLDVFVIPNNEYRSLWQKLFKNFAIRYQKSGIRGSSRFKPLIELVGSPIAGIAQLSGHENFDFPGSTHLTEGLPEFPDIISCHNLHGEYFDLRALPELSHKFPVVLSLHDAWLLSGHCAHSFGCERWRTGCGDCPDITLPPAILKDATAFNWELKKEIYSESKFYITTPCNWLMDKVRVSILNQSIQEARVIPYGIDLNIYKPGNMVEIRKKLNLPVHAIVLLFSANNFRNNPWKNFKMIQEAIFLLANQKQDISYVFVGLGDHSPVEKVGNVELRFIPFETNKSDEEIAAYYQASDIYIHASRADTFPLAILEAQACGKPVIATAVGGIPEQIIDFNTSSMEYATGFLVPDDVSGARKMMESIMILSERKDLYQNLSMNALNRAKNIYDLNLYTKNHYDWYESIIDKWGSKC